MYEVVAEGDGYKVKRIEVRPGQRLSLPNAPESQRALGDRRRRSDSYNREREIRLRENDDALIPPGPNTEWLIRNKSPGLYRGPMRSVSWRGRHYAIRG